MLTKEDIEKIRQAITTGYTILWAEEENRPRSLVKSFQQWQAERDEAAVRLVFEENGQGYVKLYIAVEQDTNVAIIKKVLPQVREWRRKLTEYQGRRKSDKDEFYDYLLHLFEQDWTYRQIAEHINSEIAALLQRDKEGHQEKGFVRAFWPRAHELMRWMGVEEPADWMQHFYKNESFPPDSPVDKAMVTYRIREWKKKHTSGGGKN